MSDRALLADVRAALLVEMAGVRVGVAAPQLRGRLAEREHERRRRYARLAAGAGAVALVVAGLPVVGGMVLPAAVAPAPRGVHPASVARIDPGSGDLVLQWTWPDGRIDDGARYAGALALLRLATGDASLVELPPGAIAAAGPDERFALALPTGDILAYRSSGGHGRLTRVVDGPVDDTWLGWAIDGRLVAMGPPFAAPDARLRLRLVDLETGSGTIGTVAYGLWPLVPGSLLTWTDRGSIVVERPDASSSGTTLGSVDVVGDRPAFEPGVPDRLRMVTGLEPVAAHDGSVPRRWRSGARDDWSSAGIGPASDSAGPTVRWYVAPEGDQVVDVVRSADLLRLVALVARADGSGTRIVVLDWPGSWRDAVDLSGVDPVAAPPGAGPVGAERDATGPAGAELGDADLPAADGRATRILGVAADGRSVAVRVAGRVVVADMASGAWTGLPPGSVFVGWPEPSIAVTAAIPSAPGCQDAPPAAVSTLLLATAGSPASSGASPVVGVPGGADPWGREALAAASGVTAPSGGRLVLALPDRVCVDAFEADAVRAEGTDAGPPMRLAALPADGAPAAGLLEVRAPPADGEWIVRLRLRWHGAAATTTLLYRANTTAP